MTTLYATSGTLQYVHHRQVCQQVHSQLALQPPGQGPAHRNIILLRRTRPDGTGQYCRPFFDAVKAAPTPSSLSFHRFPYCRFRRRASKPPIPSRAMLVGSGTTVMVPPSQVGI